MIDKKPLVSIIITYLNKRRFISKTLSSVLNQTYKNFELVFVYDDTNKNDLAFIKKLIKKFRKKKLIVNKHNLGVAKSRNIALKASSGSYIAFIDSDDTWKKKKLSTQINYMIKYSSDLTFTSYNIINHNDKILGERKVTKDAKYHQIFKSNPIGLSTVVINKKKIKKPRFPFLKTQEDFALWLQLLRKGHRLKHFKPCLTNWRKTQGSLSSNIFQKIIDAFRLYYFYEKKNFAFSIYSVIVLSYNKFIKN